MKHTPGPWKLELMKGLGCFVITDESTGELICKRSIVDADSDKLTVAEHNATAYLLVAAPDFLEAAKAILNPEISNEQAYSMLKDAIKKAEGGE